MFSQGIPSRNINDKQKREKLSAFICISEQGNEVPKIKGALNTSLFKGHTQKHGQV